MKLKTSLAAALCAAGLLSGVGSAQAGIVVENWQIDLGSLGVTAGGNFTGFGVYGETNTGILPETKGIDEFQFAALFHQTTSDVGVGNVGIVGPGDLGTTDTVGRVTTAENEAGTVIKTTTGKTLNADFELTFVSTTTQEVLSFPAANGTQTNRHLTAGSGPAGLAVDETFVAANGYLNIYADVLGDGVGVAANTSTTAGGLGMDDGLLIAVLKIIPSATASGSFNLNPDALDGQDDARFELVWQLGNVLLDKDGNPLPLGDTVGLTDSNTDIDPDSDGVIDTAPTGLVTLTGSCVNDAAGFENCGKEDGSFTMQVPEPGTLALLGISLLGLAVMRRR